MDLVEIYQCFCDLTRLRILNLLSQTPLCVCHFQEIIDEPQVKISKHLSYLRERGMVETRREGNFIIYALPQRKDMELEQNLKCLQECVRSDSVFNADLRKVSKLRKSCCKEGADLPRSRRALLAGRRTSPERFLSVRTTPAHRHAPT